PSLLKEMRLLRLLLIVTRGRRAVMREREEVYETILRVPGAGLTEHLQGMHSASVVAGPRKTLVERSPRAPAQADRVSLAALPLKLLGSAQRALAGDGKNANEFIARATALLSAEVERQDASARRPNGSSGRCHLAPWQTRRVIDFVEANLATTIRLED